MTHFDQEFVQSPKLHQEFSVSIVILKGTFLLGAHYHGVPIFYRPLATRLKTHKLLQICSQAVDKLCSHCLFPVVTTSLEQAV